ncbi:hypothetical protein Leryth_005635 [Lithospermum erythrorhizon]|nr:hypothetical protein Leryth_005635 [Lithospermum erythrorhizon]
MSEVVGSGKTLQDLTDIASSSTYSEAMQTERSNNIKRRARNVAKQQGGSAFRIIVTFTESISTRASMVPH